MKTKTAFLLAVLVAVAGCASTGKPVTTRSGLVYAVVQQGSGPAARPGQHVRIHETTTFGDGRVLYSTRPGGQPLRFLLGGNQVIDGVDEGVTGMRAGERRTMIVPPALSRRSSYPEGLSPDDTLYYDVELVAIER
jgi:FKBP-type peptidyl-prolyl cis-trans isomerase